MDIKLKAHIGDALAAVFARILINDAIGLKGKHHHSRHFVHSGKMVSNEHFAKTCKRFNLFNAQEKEVTVFGYDHYGTLYESLLYDMYISKGFDEAFSFFKETAYKLYAEKNEEMPILT